LRDIFSKENPKSSKFLLQSQNQQLLRDVAQPVAQAADNALDLFQLPISLSFAERSSVWMPMLLQRSRPGAVPAIVRSIAHLYLP
jgi:hypothetical protein